LQQPTNTTAGAAISPAVTVQILDQFNNLTTSTAAVTLSATGPRAFSAASTTTVSAVSGVATFSNLHLNTAGSYTIAASSTGLTGATSTSFTVPSLPAALPIFLQQPTNTTAGAAISPAVSVQVVDAFGNLTASTAS